MNSRRIRKPGGTAERLVLAGAVAWAVLLVLVPLYLLVKYSLSDIASINTGGAPIPLWPHHPTLRTFTYLFSDSRFWAVAANSLVIALSTVALSLLLGVPASYVLGRYRFPAKRVLLLCFLSVRLFPDIASVIPVTELFIRLNAQNTYAGVVAAHTLLALPYVLFIGMSAFETIPRDLDQQAMIMGANRFHIFRTILLPLAMPGLVAAAIYTFLLSWDEFIFAYFLLGLGKISTLTLYLKQKMAYSPPQNLLATISVCLSVPVIIFSLLVQKHMSAGVLSGYQK